MHTGSSVPLNATENFNFQLGVKYVLFGFQTSTEYEYEYYSGLGNHANTNTNNIRFWKIIRIWIRIIFGLKISAEYEYEYHYSVSTIGILFEYRIIRSPLFTFTFITLHTWGKRQLSYCRSCIWSGLMIAITQAKTSESRCLNLD